MGKILVIGSLNMDLVVETDRMPATGETILGRGFMTAAGGKGANQAAAAAKLGGETCMVGCVGQDLFGEEILRGLESCGVNTEPVDRVKEAATGTASIILVNGDNSIIVDRGANSCLSPEKVESCRKLIAQSDVLLIQLETPLRSVVRAIEIARECGTMVVLNPAPVPVEAIPEALYKMVDVITPNELECEALTGMPTETTEEAFLAVRALMDKGVSQVIVTLGSKGVVYNRGAAMNFLPARKVKAVDTTGAGDSFSGAVAVALSDGKNIDDAIAFANTVASLTVQKKGAQQSLPTLEEVNAALKEIRSEQAK